jgi:hypothetical protein
MIELAALVAADHAPTARPPTPARRADDLFYPEKITLLFEAALIASANDNDRFDEWEYQFLSSLQDKVSRFGNRARLSPKQREIVDRIYREAMP